MPCSFRCSAGPTPESCRICGEPIAPAASTISRLAHGPLGAVLAVATPAARLPSNTRDVTSALVSMCEVRPLLGRPQIGHRRRAAQAPAIGQLEVAGTLLARAVEVAVARNAQLVAGLDISLAQRVRLLGVGHGKRAAGAVQGVRAALLILGLDEIGQDVVPVPAGIAELAPVPKVLGLAADVDQAVDRRAAAQHLAARPDDPPVVAARLRLGLVAPGDLGVDDGPVVADRQVNPGIAIAPAGLEQQHPVARVRRQPVRQHAAGRAGPDHDEIIGFAAPWPLPDASLPGLCQWPVTILRPTHQG